LGLWWASLAWYGFRKIWTKTLQRNFLEDFSSDATKILERTKTKYPFTEGVYNIAWLNWTNHWGKHILSSNVNWSNHIIQSTKNGPAKYLPNTDVEKLERTIWEKWISVTNWKNWKVQEFSNVIWASWWKESFWIRVENSANTIHWHPITQQEYLKLTK